LGVQCARQAWEDYVVHLGGDDPIRACALSSGATDSVGQLSRRLYSAARCMKELRNAGAPFVSVQGRSIQFAFFLLAAA
jgi:hypothetical protein